MAALTVTGIALAATAAAGPAHAAGADTTHCDMALIPVAVSQYLLVNNPAGIIGSAAQPGS
jgi:hypothetical protein